MLLMPTSEPPPARFSGISPAADSVKPVAALRDSTSHNIPAVPSTMPQKAQACQQENDSGADFFQSLSVPTVVLDAPLVTHNMAATLSLALLGHTLFLKSQVPFPVAQLLRMPGGGSNAKVAKKREELLATFDTLSSHLRTTFVALSTAYAKCKSAKDKAAALPGDENSQKVSQAGSSATGPQRGHAHLMFILGPSVGAARARILLTIDGLEVKVWGEREDVRASEESEESDDEGSVDIEGTDEDEEDTDEVEEEYEGSEEGDSAHSSEGDEETSEEEDELDELDSEVESDSASGPPASRSPSPDPPTRSLAPSPESLASPQTSFKPLAIPSEPRPTQPMPQASATSAAAPAPPSVPPAPAPAPSSASRQPSPAAAATPTPTYAEEQAALRAAERLLSRTLMTAWADGGGDMASELAPTQTHIFLRAPRRFAHPAWAARQNLTRSLDGVLDASLVDAGARAGGGGKPKTQKTRGVTTEGVWIASRGGSAFAAAEEAHKMGDAPLEEDLDGERDEEDEEIWWAWEGKIVGFADW